MLTSLPWNMMSQCLNVSMSRCLDVSDFISFFIYRSDLLYDATPSSLDNIISCRRLLLRVSRLARKVPPCVPRPARA